MKRLSCLILTFVMFFSMQGCVNIFGGNNQRQLGRWYHLFSDGDKTYFLSRDYFYLDGYIEITADSFKLRDGEFDDTAFPGYNCGIEVLLSGVANEDFGDSIIAKDGYEYLIEQIYEAVGRYKTFEVIVLKKDDEIYGAVNCYKRPSGRSGNLLSNEDLGRSYLLEIKDDEITFTKDLGKTAVLALNDTHYIAYKEKNFFSVSKDSGEQTPICKDIWWSEDSLYCGSVQVLFVGDVFVMYCDRNTPDYENYTTLIVGDISGERIKVLLDDVKR